MSQLFWPEIGLQVPHLGGVTPARARLAVVRKIKNEYFISRVCFGGLGDWSLVWMRSGMKDQRLGMETSLYFYTSRSVLV